MPSHHVREFMREHGSDFGFVVHQSQQTGADINRSVRQGKRIRDWISQRAKFPDHVLEIQTAGHENLADTLQISIGRVIFKNQSFALESPVKQVYLFEEFQ